MTTHLGYEEYSRILMTFLKVGTPFFLPDDHETLVTLNVDRETYISNRGSYQHRLDSIKNKYNGARGKNRNKWIKEFKEGNHLNNLKKLSAYVDSHPEPSLPRIIHATCRLFKKHGEKYIPEENVYKALFEQPPYKYILENIERGPLFEQGDPVYIVVSHFDSTKVLGYPKELQKAIRARRSKGGKQGYFIGMVVRYMEEKFFSLAAKGKWYEVITVGPNSRIQVEEKYIKKIKIVRSTQRLMEQLEDG